MGIEQLIALHVAGGTIWLLMSLWGAVRGRTRRTVFVLQMVAASAAVAAGTFLWHAKHPLPFGPTEHWLVVGTFAAFAGAALQIGVAPLCVGARETRLAAGGLAIVRIAAALLVLAAVMMLGSLVA